MGIPGRASMPAASGGHWLPRGPGATYTAVVVTTVYIADMLSVHAVRAVTTALGAVEGIAASDVRLGVAVVEHDGRATASALREAIEAAGFRVTKIDEEPRRLQVRSD